MKRLEIFSNLKNGSVDKQFSISSHSLYQAIARHEAEEEHGDHAERARRKLERLLGRG